MISIEVSFLEICQFDRSYITGCLKEIFHSEIQVVRRLVKHSQE